MHYEHEALKEKHEKLFTLVGEIIEVLKQQEITKLEAKKKLLRCRYWNRGFCREGQSCEYFHSSEVCDEHLERGSCSLGRGVHEDILKDANTDPEATVGEDALAYISTLKKTLAEKRKKPDKKLQIERKMKKVTKTLNQRTKGVK